MVRRLLPLGLSLSLTCAGCLPDDRPNTLLVQPSPFGNVPAPPAPRVACAPATGEAAMRVNDVGQKIVQANKQAGLRPVFVTAGAPQPEIFHKGTTQVFITEGMVKQCATEGQLAAVLCLELGKMVSEREALAGPQARSPELEPPVELRVGGDSGGTFGPADATRLAELGKYEQARRPARGAPLPPPDPNVLARTYLAKAGYPAAELDMAQPLVQAAAANYVLERQFANTTPADRPATPVP